MVLESRNIRASWANKPGRVKENGSPPDQRSPREFIIFVNWQTKTSSRYLPGTDPSTDVTFLGAIFAMNNVQGLFLYENSRN